ncbi:hypothetical protein [Allostreptomyces psammosilenae]|uniref:Uncharacterized protein n=1 Tax=Allostreptomyces psammosilenae TaxID=1892865 RepID=A0A853A0V2_9ACTN|nr:hypothetical protein [Allostreptomyces psammosilenae]NYI08196.1 hypothetical protein [Allostreptomyces psammosilenae]
MNEQGGTMAGRRPGVWSTTGAFGRALGLLLAAWLVAGTIAGVSYLALSTVGVPIVLGVVLCFAFGAAVVALHRAWWLGFLSLLPSVMVLVGAVQYAPEAALEQRGVREQVTIVGADVTGNRHRFELQKADGTVLDESLDYQGSSPPYSPGDNITVIRDPEGVVPLEEATRVDSAGRLGTLLAGISGWTLIAPLAVGRGHIRRIHGRPLRDLPTF